MVLSQSESVITDIVEIPRETVSLQLEETLTVDLLFINKLLVVMLISNSLNFFIIEFIKFGKATQIINS